MARPEGTAGKADYLPPDKVHAVAQALGDEPEGLRNQALWWLGLSTACRVGEMLQLRVCDVWVEVPERGCLHNIVVDGSHTKTGKTRTVPVNRMAREAIGIYMLSRGAAGPGEPLFPSSRSPGRPLGYNRVEVLIHRAGLAAGLRFVRSHSMRRTAATEWMNAGVSIRAIQELLGHANLQITQEYLSVSPGMLNSAAEGLSDLYSSSRLHSAIKIG
jgi:integrase/recombinase XerD